MSAKRWIPDATALSAFRENPELFRLRHRLNLVPASPDDKMRAGSALHVGLDALRRGRPIEEAVSLTRAARSEAPGVRDAAQCERIVRAYAVRYAVEPWALVESEAYVQARIEWTTQHTANVTDDPRCIATTHSFDYCGIQDAVVRFADGSEYVVDTKSTGAYLNEGWQETMALSDQLVGYVAMRRALGYRCDGFIVDGIHVNDYVPKGGGGPKVDAEKDFARVGPVSVPEWRVERWARDVRYTLRAIAELERERGVDSPWPVYQNFAFGKVGAYGEFFRQPAELHAQVAATFETRAWSPREVAEDRAASASAKSTDSGGDA